MRMTENGELRMTEDIAQDVVNKLVDEDNGSYISVLHKIDKYGIEFTEEEIEEMQEIGMTEEQIEILNEVIENTIFALLV